MKVMVKMSILLIIVGFALSANRIDLNSENQFNYELDNPSQIIVDINLGDIEYVTINKEGEEYIRLNINNAHQSRITGAPELPQINNLIEIPRGATPYIQIINDDIITFDLNSISNNAKIYPSQPSMPKSGSYNLEFVTDQNIYLKNENFSFDLVNIVNKGMLREVQIGNLVISPIEYNPITNKLIIHKNIKFIIHFDGVNLDFTKQIKEKYQSYYFETILSNSLLNYNSYRSRSDDFMHDEITYLIIADQVFNGYLDEFIAWKTQKGFNVITGYTNNIGSSSSSIRAFIQEHYTNPQDGTSPVSFVLLVGDTNQIPASYSSGGHVSDLDYCDMTNDNVPDILCGRFSAQTPVQLVAQIEKTIEYEKFEMPDPSFLEEVILISGVDASYAPTYGNGQINYGTDYYFNGLGGINSNTFLYPASGSSGSQILSLASQGASFINYTAHGYEQGWADPSFDNNDADNMNNNQKYPTMVGNCCLTNAFDTGTCFGEALLRKNNGGAIGYIGGSDVTYWNEDYWWGVGNGSISANPTYNGTGEGAYDGMFHNNSEYNLAVVNSAIIMVGNLAVVEANGMDDYYWEIYHLMGDPSLSTYVGIPSINNVDHPIFLSPGATEITINAEPFSYVGLTKNGQLIGSGLVDEFGIGNISLTNTNEPGEIDITATGQNMQPYFGTIILSTPDGPYVSVNDVFVNLGSDNSISLGENISVDITIENFGSETASNIILQLEQTSLSPYITITDGFETVDSLADGDTASIRLEFNVSNSAPYGHAFTLSISLDSENNSYTTDLNLNVENLQESFESGSLTNMAWQLDGNANWSIDFSNASDGMYSAKSGSIGNNTISVLEILIDVVEDGIISFSKNVSCEAPGSFSGNYYDFLAFYIDDIEQGRWAGEISWSQNTYNVTAGNHTFKWSFTKDQDTSDDVESGQDAVWIDSIIFPAVFGNDNNTMLGDVNGDSNINIQDVVLIVNVILSGQVNDAADVNQDGNIDVLDIIQVVNLILNS